MHISIRKCINLNLKFRKKKVTKRRGPLTGTLSLLLLTALQHRLDDATSFRLSKSLYYQSVPFKRTNNFGSVFTNLLDRRIYETKSPIHFGHFFFLCLFVVSRCLFFDAQKLLLFVTVAMLSRYHSPVNCRSRKVGCNLTHKVNYPYCCHWQGWN